MPGGPAGSERVISGRTIRRAITGLGGTSLILALALTLTAFRPSAGVKESPKPQTEIILKQITPVSVQPGKTLRVTGRFTTDTELRNVRMQLEIGPSPFVTRTAVTEAAASPPSTTPVSGAFDALGLLRPGGSRKFSIAVPTDDLGLAAAGVYPLRIVATAGPLDAVLDSSSTFLPWAPEGVGTTASRLLFIWPLIDVPRRDATGTFTSPGLGAEIRPKGRLGTLTAAGQSAPVTWLIDPSLLSDVAALGTSSSRTWLTDLPTAIGNRETAVLPYGDPDLAAVAAADRINLLRQATVMARSVAELALGRTVRTDLGWPADGAADATTIDGAHRAGSDLLLLDETSVPLATALPYTPSGRVALTEPGVDLLLADRTASALVASPARGSNDIVLSRQRFLAETLLHTLELPAEPRLLIVAPPRRWDPDPGWARALVQATKQASWLNPVTLDQAVRPSPPNVERSEPSIPDAVAERQLPPDLVLRAAQALPQARKFHAILTRPAVLARPIEEAIYTSLSTAWRTDHQAAALSQGATINRLASQRSRVSIVSRGGTLSDDRGLLPVTIRNQLDQPVVVRLSVVSADPLRLRVKVPDESIRVAASGVESVSVALDAVTSGRLTVDAQILTPKGQVYSDPVQLDVDVRAYGQVALIVFGAAAALMVLAAIVRITRRLRARRGAP
jgi:hypothetical protein